MRIIELKNFGVIFICLVFLFTFTTGIFAKIVTMDVDYKDGDTELQGYLAYDDALSGKRPGVMIVHEWNGLGKYVKMRAEMLAKLGYVAFCADIYGKGIRPQTMDEMKKQAGIYRADRKMMRKRALAGLNELEKQDMVDTGKIAVIGYCFGGGVALELARSGADVKGVVSFHGNLDTPDLNDAKNIKAKVLVLHGANDQSTSPEQLQLFMKEMRDAKVDWQMNIYGNAVHGFTNQMNGNDPNKPVAYNAEADARSWEAMKAFFDGIFEKK
jgi:dienelactone hydrolase